LRRNSRLSAAFQGELGAFSHAAAKKLLGERVEVTPCESFKAVFETLARGSVTYAVVPIENTLHGSVHENYDNLLDSDSSICGETSIRISHHLIGLPGTRFRQIDRAFSHPVALNQCRKFFENNPGIKPMSFYDTAGSVKMLTEDRPARAAAIASETAAEIYGAAILKRNLEDNPQNFTRFFLLSKQQRRTQPPGGAWKTSIVFSTANAPGAVF
jgi:prephenate dehydratase